MKKALWIIAAAAWAVSPALWGQSITVTAPAAGSEWCAGTTQVIAWTSSGVAGPLSIKLRLAGAPDAPQPEDSAQTDFQQAAPGEYEQAMNEVSAQSGE